jgi:ComF family protein
LCEAPTGTSLVLCEVCRGELLCNHPCCRCCALPFQGSAIHAATLCPACLVSTPLLEQVVAPFVYEEGLAFLISRWKYQREGGLVSTFAELWLQATDGVGDVDLLIPIPLHWRRLLSRGFNQSADLAEELGRRLEIPQAPSRLLRRMRATPAQVRAGRSERLANLLDAFSVDGTLSRQRVALVDDVCTTGATGEAAARALLRAGATSVQLWCLARTPA